MSGEPDDDDTPVEGARDADPRLNIPNAADVQSIARTKQIAKFSSQQRADFWKKMLSDPLGRTVMWEVLTDMHTFNMRFATSPAGFPDAHATWFYAGEQSAGWRLYDALRKAAFGEVHLMHLEHDAYFEQVKPRRKR